MLADYAVYIYIKLKIIVLVESQYSRSFVQAMSLLEEII